MTKAINLSNSHSKSNSKITLASTSPFRREILEKLALEFDAIAPDCDETPLEGEPPIELVERLAISKAKSVADMVESNQSHLIIGSDQVALFDGNIIGKPHTRENAIKQLSSFSGHSVTFYTGLCVYQAGKIDTTIPDTTKQQYLSLVEPFTVHFRDLTNKQIEYYIDQEKPLNCAGSFKSEGLGISLFKKLEGDDPNTLIGLPLIKLIELMKRFGFDVLSQ